MKSIIYYFFINFFLNKLMWKRVGKKVNFQWVRQSIWDRDVFALYYQSWILDSCLWLSYAFHHLINFVSIFSFLVTCFHILFIPLLYYNLSLFSSLSIYRFRLVTLRFHVICMYLLNIIYIIVQTNTWCVLFWSHFNL